MSIRERISGNEAVAYAMRQINPDVFAAFPITPSTEIPQYFAQYVANGQVDTEYVTVESEHSSMSTCIGAWSATKRIPKEYVRFINDKRPLIEITFVKVPSHSGIQLNEEVDSLARGALLAKGHKTYNDGSVYFTGHGLQDWKRIIHNLNKENESLSDASQNTITCTEEHFVHRDKLKVVQGRQVVSINCYVHNTSYVQGKQSVLFQKIVSSAIADLGNNHTVVETLNHYHALMLTEQEVTTQFENLLPHYRNMSDKLYRTLLLAVYNTMLTGYMPDYTGLVTPIFRSYEYYLHRILGDKMGLPTETATGKNVFSFFSKTSSGMYECNKPETSKLSTVQLNYLNKLYTKYHAVRHPYSHWSFDDIDTAVIEDISIARDLLIEGLELVDEYYTLF